MEKAHQDQNTISMGDYAARRKLLASSIPIASEAAADRLYYLDWLRVVVVLGVFFAHSIDLFNFVDPDLKHQERATGIMIPTIFIAEWGMALFFLLAGASAWFSLRHRAGLQFLAERFKRLVLPFFIGALVLSPPLAYIQAIRSSSYEGPFFQFSLSFFQSIHADWDPRWVATFSFHLWFLLFLFVISSLALPLLLLMRRASCYHLLAHFATFCERYDGLFVFALPLALLQIPLRLTFPGYQSWADFFSWLLFFLYGYLLVAHPQFASALHKQKGVILGVGVIGPLIFFVLYRAGFVEIWEHATSFSIGYICYQFLRALTAWSWTLIILWVGIHFLNFSHPVLTYTNQAVLPFYMLHYPVLVFMAFAISKWNINMVLQFLLTSIVSLLVTLVFYDPLIRHIPVMRWFFGLKPEGGIHQESPGSPISRKT